MSFVRNNRDLFNVNFCILTVLLMTLVSDTASHSIFALNVVRAC